ncbi:MAG: signal peptidase II [Acidobacteria bacterium]|nr:MAG: signal peptidase II [Acidobacteriota bacterium]
MEKCTMRIPHRLAAYQPTGYTEFDPMSFKLQGRMPYLLLVIATLILDRWTKAWIQNRFELNASATVIDGLFNITYVRNTGVAFGIFSSISSPAKSLLLSIFTAFAAILVITYSVRSSARNRLLQVALALILGGALGNLYDRLAYGYVVDFLELYFRTYHWPSFNVADSAISIGVLLLALEIFRNESPGRT